jgi:hypothetical protein
MNITVYPLSAFFCSRVWSRRAWHGAGKLEAEGTGIGEKIEKNEK